MSLGDRIAGRMAAIGISQSELARQVGITQGAISQLIKGGSRGSSHLHKIARALNTSTAYLESETDDPDADAPAEPSLTPDEADLIEHYRQLPPEDQRAVRRIVETMIKPRTVHAPTSGYRAED